MSTGSLEAVLARLLLEPRFLEAMRRDPKSLLGPPFHLRAETLAAFESADLEKIRRFSGFISKVQHNHLWDWLPATRTLLVHYGIELEVFARYRVIQMAPELKNASREVRMNRFLHFLEDYAGVGDYPGLIDMIRHERAVWQVASESNAEPVADCSLPAPMIAELSWTEFQRLVPTIDGKMRPASFSLDPSELAVQITVGKFDGTTQNAPPQTFLYWRSHAGDEVRIFKADTFTAAMLSLITGKRQVRSVIGIARRRYMASFPPRVFRSFFEDAAASTFIRMRLREGK